MPEEPVSFPLNPPTPPQTPAAADPAGSPPADEVAAAAGSALDDLRVRRARHTDNLFIDLKVPRWDDDGGAQVWVRYRPASPGKVNAVGMKRLEHKAEHGDAWLVLANADILIESCLGVYGVLPDDPTRYSFRRGDPAGPWTKFDPDLADSLGLEAAKATDVVRALYLTEGDLIAACDQLCEWSQVQSVKADEAFLGN
jgi:hypothetical protein